VVSADQIELSGWLCGWLLLRNYKTFTVETGHTTAVSHVDDCRIFLSEKNRQ